MGIACLIIAQLKVRLRLHTSTGVHCALCNPFSRPMATVQAKVEYTTTFTTVDSFPNPCCGVGTASRGGKGFSSL